MDDHRIDLGHGAFVREDELSFVAVRASGPGGQHVNTTATAVTVRWNVAGSPSLTESQRARILTALANRVDSEGVLAVTSRETRSQLENRMRARARLLALVRAALVPPRPRRPTRVPRAEKRRRLETKRRRSALKKSRQGAGNDDR
ncbi:MAG: aminoacyl-tRNA hydrolase [Desulfovibrionaceae bacterium]|jgi:ribosome-associated protein|nr:aminoacyl-tRNA hydrolase [Desulfovibrionaceae bacterium]